MIGSLDKPSLSEETRMRMGNAIGKAAAGAHFGHKWCCLVFWGWYSGLVFVSA